jgi:protocatechuate 3,4-dioxygenase beta subunit
LWQAKAAGCYRHEANQPDAPLDPDFRRTSALVTDGEGLYKSMAKEPGATPWGEHHNAWRPKHIHFFWFGLAGAARLVTQVDFDGDGAVVSRAPDEVRQADAQGQYLGTATTDFRYVGPNAVEAEGHCFRDH